ncbi:MAG TPA: NUDIX domain-containing protein [Acidimicrobiales bacterium]
MERHPDTGPVDTDPALAGALADYEPRTAREAEDVARLHRAAATGDVWSRSSPLHITGSAVVVHPPTGRVLLRWHERMGSWLQVGGHADPGETDPLQTARREAAEETGLTDLAGWPDPARPPLIHVVIVPVPAGKGEPAHEHADFRYVLATDTPDAVVAETAAARLRWLSRAEAAAAVAWDNLNETLSRLPAA